MSTFICFTTVRLSRIACCCCFFHLVASALCTFIFFDREPPLPVVCIEYVDCEAEVPYNSLCLYLRNRGCKYDYGLVWHILYDGGRVLLDGVDLEVSWTDIRYRSRAWGVE